MTIITMPSGRIEHCSKPGTCRRHSPHARTGGSGTVSKNAFLKDFQATQQSVSKTAQALAPIHVAPSALHEPREVIAHSQEVDNRYNNRDIGVIVDYTGTGEIGYYGDEGDPVRIQQVTVTEVNNLRGVVASVFGIDKSQVTPELLDQARALGLDTPDAYETEIYQGADEGYYDEAATNDTYYVKVKDVVHEQLTALFYNRPNAQDHQGILAYCRGKGLDTTGLRPEEALVKQLAVEHPGLVKKLARVKHVSTTTLRHDMVELNEKRMQAANATKEYSAPVSAKSRHESIKTFAGVVYRIQRRIPGARYGSQTVYTLIDGYNRDKAIKTKRSLHDYIVVSV